MSYKRRTKETEAKASVKEKMVKKMKSLVKSKDWINLYACLETHVKIIRERVDAGVPGFTKVPRLHKKMDMKQLQELYDKIHADEYGHL